VQKLAKLQFAVFGALLDHIDVQFSGFSQQF